MPAKAAVYRNSKYCATRSSTLRNYLGPHFNDIPSPIPKANIPPTFGENEPCESTPLYGILLMPHSIHCEDYPILMGIHKNLDPMFVWSSPESAVCRGTDLIPRMTGGM